MKLNYINEKYNFLAPIIKNKLIRLLNKMDGGYIVDNEIISKLDTFISFGLGNGLTQIIYPGLLVVNQNKLKYRYKYLRSFGIFK